MNPDRRSLVAFALIFLFLYIWFEFFVPKPQKVPSPTQEAAPAEVITASPPTAPTLAPPPSIQAARQARSVAEKSSFETDVLRLTMTGEGGAPNRLHLKNYRVSAHESSSEVAVIPFQEEAPPPLQWSFDLGGERLNDDDGEPYLVVHKGERDITYERRLASGWLIRKTWSWERSEYHVEERVELINGSGRLSKISAEARLSAVTDPVAAEKSAREKGIRAVALVSEKVFHLSPDDVKKGKSFPEGHIRWGGFATHYFLLAALPLEGAWSGIRISSPSPTSGGVKPELDRVNVAYQYPAREVESGKSQVFRLKLYAGPKDIGVLRQEDATLDKAIDLGDWLGPISRPILLFLRWLHQHVGNYGIAIILLTVLVRLLLFPLTQMQARSMKRLQEHQPALGAIKEKHKNDKEAQARETMSYMRQNRLNPMGGCLLLLPQMPILFALYRVLDNAIELRHAPFGLWLKDLSAHDPWFVLPVVLGALMFVQTRMTPTATADPAQQAMMKFMPVMFSALMIFLPAGLNLYILVSTFWGIVQQYGVQKSFGPGPLLTQASGGSDGRMDRNRG